MQFVGIRFSAKQERIWTYHHVPGGVAVGDVVEVKTPRDGLVEVPVVRVSDVDPGFRTKPIERVVSRAATDDAAHRAPAHSPSDGVSPDNPKPLSDGETEPQQQKEPTR